MPKLQDFQNFIYQNIPLVSHMQLKLNAISSHQIKGTAPLGPNINDKATVFGGSSAALMTICGWSLIKYHLEAHQLDHDVVIQRSELKWLAAQKADLHIQAQLNADFDWPTVLADLMKNNHSVKIQVTSEILNPSGERCSVMSGTYVILKKGSV